MERSYSYNGKVINLSPKSIFKYSRFISFSKFIILFSSIVYLKGQTGYVR